VPAVLYAAPVVCPMTGPPLGDGGVLVAGERITEVGPAADLAPLADRVHRLDGVLLPALVNGHTVLELTDAAALAVPGPAHAHAWAVEGRTAGWTADAWARSARRGVQLALRPGTGLVGDVVLRGPAVPAAGRAGLGGDSRVAVEHVDVGHADDVVARVQRALDLPTYGRRTGIAPGIATVSTGVLQALAALAGRRDAPLHLVAARSNPEVVALRTGEGPLAERARQRGLELEWLEGGSGLSPVRYLDACGALGPRTTLAHGVVVDVLEARLLAARRTTVVCCPRADALRGSPAAPLERYAETGVPLALGTDSCASVPDLDVLAEAAAWVAAARERELVFWPSAVGPVPLEEQAVRLATVDGARALGWGDSAGVLEPGRRADLVAVDVDTTTQRVYRDLVEHGPGRQVLTVLAGVRRARRPSAAAPWPEIDRHELEG